MALGTWCLLHFWGPVRVKVNYKGRKDNLIIMIENISWRKMMFLEDRRKLQFWKTPFVSSWDSDAAPWEKEIPSPKRIKYSVSWTSKKANGSVLNKTCFFSSSIPWLGRSSGKGIGYPLQYSWASLVAQLVKNLPVIQETLVLSLVWEDPLEKGKATHSRILANSGEFHILYSPWGCKESDMTEWLSLHFTSSLERVVERCQPPSLGSDSLNCLAFESVSGLGKSS